jgi:hypothetical protein
MCLTDVFEHNEFILHQWKALAQNCDNLTSFVSAKLFEAFLTSIQLTRETFNENFQI